ncbi:MAG TPA: hypothetical protein EYH30_07555 [Anaerolineales bacterium]|nr:hypothetical protein [Anaerolineae bacterium]HIQ01973.1 hypothetical protein [Anaerolineales bacterium]
MNNYRERLAWLILLVSFTFCVGLIVGMPLGVRHFLRTASTDQKAALEPQRGTPRVQRRGRGPVIALIGPMWDVPAGTVVTTDDSAQSLLTLYAPGEEPAVVATIQIYGDTEMVLVSSRSPRFKVSPLPHRVVLEMRVGRIRVSVTPAGERNTVVELHTPHLTALLDEGSYEARVRPARSEVTVRDGAAQVTSANGESVTLEESQRTVAQIGGSTLEVGSAERNLLTNGNFRQPLEGGWEEYHNEQQPPAGEVEIIEFEGRPVARFHRNGIGHAEVGIRQEINYDIRDFTSLVLHLSVRVQGQSLPGCGSAGSECPIIIRVDYKDIYGTDRTWYYGFFSGDPGGNFLYPWDEQIPFQTWYTFDSGNLIDSKNPTGAFVEPPALIKSVAIYASGHSFDALVTEVELLAQE